MNFFKELNESVARALESAVSVEYSDDESGDKKQLFNTPPEKPETIVPVRDTAPFSKQTVQRESRATFSFLNVSSRMSVKDQTFLIKRLSFLMRSGVPLFESLHILRSQTKTRSHGRMLDDILQGARAGQSLSRSMARHPRVFGDFAVNIVRVGETSGILSENLEYLADELKKKQMLRRKVIGALVYPAIISLATIGITVFLMVYLFPKIMPIFTSLKMSLPLSTRMVIGMSEFLRTKGLYLLFGCIAAVIAFAQLVKRHAKTRYMTHYLLLRMPGVGKLVQDYNLANTTRTLGLMLKSGLTVSEALPLTADTAHNVLYKMHYKGLSESVRRGERLSSYLLQYPWVFPDIMTQMVAVGESSGNLSNTLMYLADYYEAEVEDFTKDISTLVEPALMIVMGVLVGFIAVSIITPIYGITQNLHA